MASLEIYRLLALYRQRLRLLDDMDPRLALVALGEEGEYARYRDHFKRKIWQLEAELERETQNGPWSLSHSF